MEVDVNKPVENPELKALLNKRTTCSQEELLDVMNQIAEEIATKAHFLAVVAFDDASVQHNADGSAIFSKDTVISFPALSDANGRPVQPLFTDWEELRKWEPFNTDATKTFILSFDDAVAMVSNNRGSVVINPFGDFLELPFDILEHIKKVKESKTAAVQEQVEKRDVQDFRNQ